MRKEKKRKLSLDDFFETSYGQTKKEVLADYEHYLKTGEIR
jgi:hypothetical protein